MNATQRQSATLVLAAAYRESGAPMDKVQAVLHAAESGDPVACRALAYDCMRVANVLDAAGDERYAILLEPAAEFDATALEGEVAGSAIH